MREEKAILKAPLPWSGIAARRRGAELSAPSQGERNKIPRWVALLIRLSAV